MELNFNNVSDVTFSKNHQHLQEAKCSGGQIITADAMNVMTSAEKTRLYPVKRACETEQWKM